MSAAVFISWSRVISASDRRLSFERHIHHLATDHAGMTRSLRQTHNEIATHEGIAMRLRRTQQRKRMRQKRITREDRGGFIESLVHRRFAAAQIVVVHRGQIVMDERIGVNAFHRRSDAAERTAIHAEQTACLQDKESAQPLAATKRRIAHGLQHAAFRSGDGR